MIIKSYELNKINLDKNKFILFYGKNEGLKNEATSFLTNNKNKIQNYEEKEIINNEENFINSLLTKSLFDEQRVIIVKRATNRIIDFIENLSSKNLDDILIIINADNLEKKSKLRSFFEKDRDYACVAFYPDNDQTLAKLAYNFLKKQNISISPSNINLIINKCNGDRENLLNELKKIENFSKSGKKLTSEVIAKLTNIIENHSISELIDNCLAKNKKKL